MSDFQNARAHRRAIIDEREAESRGDLYDSDSDCCASEGHAVLPDVLFEDCPSVLNARALTIHAQRHEAALDAATQRIAVLEKMVDRLNNIVTPLMFDYELRQRASETKGAAA